jgi:pSer/pThr/pTyr-binding forkhead associated (FHA) protein
MARYALKFISGKYQDGEFPLPDRGEVLIGRTTDLDLVLVEDMVSRKHAKLTIENESLTIMDLGSTNGTFVNGEKIKRREVKDQDRILIGTSIIKVVHASQLSGDSDAADVGAIKQKMEELGSRAPRTAAMSGDLGEVPLPDLLQLFATNRKSGILVIHGPHSGKVFLHLGQLECASVGDGTELKPMKALCRMLGWSSGSFQFDPYEEGLTFPEKFQGSTESILIEALRQTDECKRILGDMPTPETKLQMCVPLAPKLSDLKKEDLETLQSVINFGVLQSIVDKSPETDLDILTSMRKLIKEGYVEVS